MSFPVEKPDQRGTWVEILKETELYTFGKKQFRIVQATLRFVAIPFAEAMAMIAIGEINDAKTIIALQYLALQKVNELPMG